jgi:hypothetical protein
MELFLSFLILIISTIVGFFIGIFLNINSYLIISIIIICLFIAIDVSYEFINCNKKHNGNIQPNNINLLNINNNDIIVVSQTTVGNVTDYHPAKDDKNGNFAKEKELIDTKYGIFKKKDEAGNDKNSLPLDGLSPKDLITSLNYITYSTSNPYKPISYNNYKMHADKYLDEDGTKLSTNDIKLQEFAKAHYPQLTSDQIDARDCLNYGSGKNSCFQSAQLFDNVNKNFGILSNGVNEDNSNLIIKEDFTNPMILNNDSRYEKILFKNAPTGNLDKILDNQSNESINLDNSIDLCRNCKVAVCKDDYCGLQNHLFM